jgi:hypothetical protein
MFSSSLMAGGLLRIASAVIPKMADVVARDCQKKSVKFRPAHVVPLTLRLFGRDPCKASHLPYRRDSGKSATTLIQHLSYFQAQRHMIYFDQQVHALYTRSENEIA